MKRIVPLVLSSALWACCAGAPLKADKCSIVPPHVPGEAEKAYLAADYERAADLYRKALEGAPADSALIAGLSRSLQRQQKTEEAVKVVTDAIAAHPDPELLVVKAEAELHDGRPWDAEKTAQAAGKDNICSPRMHLLLARIDNLNSNYAAGHTQLALAHQLDPNDLEIRRMWASTLPARDQIAELENLLSTPGGYDADERRAMEQTLAHLRKVLAEPSKPCRLVSGTSETQIAFSRLMRDAMHVRAYGLNVKINQRNANLEIDTGASGLVISHSVAEHAGIKPFSEMDVRGLGDKNQLSGYRGYADSIQIGGLEFHDCVVTVVENSRMMDIDGLIGMNVFSRFLVTLDYPGRKLLLGPLPPRPDDTTPVAPSLNATNDTNETKSGEEPAQERAAAAPKKAASSLHNRYIAPEMKDYTPVYRVGHDLMLPVALNSSKLKLFVLDTGSWATNISPEAAREVTKVHSDDHMSVRGLNGRVDKVYSADEITFAFARVSQRIRDVPSFDTGHVSRAVGLKISGFLGARTLELTTIHIDYRDGLVKFDYDPKRIPIQPSY